jgi:hypothetical protein
LAVEVSNRSPVSEEAQGIITRTGVDILSFAKGSAHLVAKALLSLYVLVFMIASCKAQTSSEKPSSPIPKSNEELQVNWLYGGYVPKNVPLHPRTNHQRLQLFLRQSFTAPGVYT